MIPLESPVPEIGTPGSESGGGNVPMGFGLRPGAKAPDEPPSPTGYAPPLDSTRFAFCSSLPLRLRRWPITPSYMSRRSEAEPR